MSLQINIYTPGSHSKEFSELIDSYVKRSSRFAKVSWIFTKGVNKKTENDSLKAQLTSKNYIVLDEHGKNITTLDFSNHLSQQMQSGKPVINLVIGGAYGLNEEVIDKASAVWAFGHITLPHQLVRLIALEQIYRSLTILNNHPYHHS